MPSPQGSANGLTPALQVINTGDKGGTKLFPFLLDREVYRCGIKLLPSWKPDLCGSLGSVGCQAGHDLEGHYFKRSEASSGKLLCFGGSLGEHINADHTIERQENQLN